MENVARKLALSENVYENVTNNKKEKKSMEIKPVTTTSSVQEILDMMLLNLFPSSPSPNSDRLKAAKEEGGNDAVEVLVNVFPVVVDIQLQTLESLGITTTADGLKDFLLRVQQLQLDDPSKEEVRKKLAKIQHLYLPPFSSFTSSYKI